eukprot:s652_g23.t1
MPCKVVRSWSACKLLCKPSNNECGDSVFVGLPSEREARRAPWPSDQLPYILDEGTVNSIYPVGLFVVDQAEGASNLQIIQIGEIEGRHLVCVPFSTWNRSISRRVLPPAALLKPTLVEVAAAYPNKLAVQAEDYVLKVWIGYLKPEYIDHIELLEEFDVEHFFDEDPMRQLLPLAQALVDVAQEHFVFFSANGGQLQDAPEEAEEDVDGEEMTAEELADAGLEQASSPVEQRMARLETAMASMAAELKNMVGNPPPQQRSAKPKRKAAPKATTKSKPSSRTRGLPSSSAPPVGDRYPLLDAGVVQAALQAGIPHENLEQMQALIGQGRKAAKVPDLNQRVKPNPLSEDEEPVYEEQEAAMGEESGLGEGRQMAETLSRLTAIMEMLTEDKKKKAQASKLETALDGVATSSGDPLQAAGSGKKNAIARRALRTAFEDHPQEIYALIEKHMAEDLTSSTVGPGMETRTICARAWVEFRSHIGSFKTGAYAAWCLAGIHDALMQGHVTKARARSAVALLAFDQVAIDRGNWLLASELLCEPPPPFSALSAHVPPAVQDGESPYSRLLDPRWSEIALAHLREQDEYLQRRRNVGKMQKGGKEAGQDEGTESEPKRRPKQKAKAKSQAAGTSPDL